MNKAIPNQRGLREEMEKRVPALALNASGSYVRPSFDPAEWERVQKLDFNRIQFSDEDFVVIARGSKGSLARFAKVSADRRYARYLGGKFISIALIEGDVYSKPDFLRSISGNTVLRVVRAGTEFVGILHGNLKSAYKTLVYLAGDRFLFLDLEENPPPQNISMLVRIVAVDPPDGEDAKTKLLACRL